MNFLSDDTAPVAPAILNAIAQANAGRTSRRRLDPIRRAAIIRNFERERRCPGANRDSGERAGCARYGKTVYFVLKEEITVGSWPRATLNLLDALRYIANADRIFVLSALAGSW